MDNNDVDNDDENFYYLLCAYFVKGILYSFIYSGIHQMFVEYVLDTIRNWVKKGWILYFLL